MRGTARGMMTATCLAAACLLALAAGAEAEMHPQLAGMNTVHTQGDTGLASLHTARPIAEAVLGSEDAGWYHGLFANEAMRAVEAQRRLTSYTDPFTGWVQVDGSAFVVRQRSPYKESLDLKQLATYADFAEYVEQIAAYVASHLHSHRA